jgi:ribose transport system substrate-binding protein
MGYMIVQTAYQVAFEDKPVEHFVDTGFIIVDKDNIDTKDAKNVLY